MNDRLKLTEGEPGKDGIVEDVFVVHKQIIEFTNHGAFPVEHERNRGEEPDDGHESELIAGRSDSFLMKCFKLISFK